MDSRGEMRQFVETCIYFGLTDLYTAR